ncbi:MAG: AzlC family ABC transporter permease [Oleiphilaceae bacterium]|nr:AzlC family ABC transporter permease [Oleiphilaceae bacterium]
MAFGVLFTSQLDYSWWVAPVMGIVIFAGAGQILAVSLLAAKAELMAVFIAMLALNSRHVFYGLSLLGHFSGAGWRKLYLVFGLTDETYSLLTSRHRSSDREEEQRTDALITLFNQAYWVLGCGLGAWLGSTVKFDSTGIEFALVALFLVLAIEQYRAIRRQLPFWVGAAGAGLAVTLLPQAHQLIGAILVATLALLINYRLTTTRRLETGDRPHG